MNVYNSIIQQKALGKKQFAILVDPDKVEEQELLALTKLAVDARADYFFVGGSLLTNGNVSTCIQTLKQNCKIPVVLFPGNPLQMNASADALLFLSLISGRNADMLIGNHVIAAPILKAMQQEVISTGYMLIDSGKQTTASYMSSTTPIPHDKNDIAACTALAGEMLGLKLIYMDGGSGAVNPISEKMIAKVSEQISIPLIVGGGIQSPEKAYLNCKAGADIIVVGNAIEKNPLLINELSAAVHTADSSLV